MKMRNHIAVVLLACLIFNGCASWSTQLKYRQRSYIPGPGKSVIGYEDEQLGEYRYQVRVGEAWPKDWSNLEKIAMYRAADITKRRGEKFFVIVDGSNITTDHVISTPQTTYTTGSATAIGSSIYGSATSTTYGGTTGVISGGWYYLDFRIVPQAEVQNLSGLISADQVMKDLEYFISKRR